MFDSEVGDTVPGGPRPAASGRLPDGRLAVLVTCVVTNAIDQTKMAEFECFAKRWMGLADAHGGTRRGNSMPAEAPATRRLRSWTSPAWRHTRSIAGCQELIPTHRSRQDQRQQQVATCVYELRPPMPEARRTELGSSAAAWH